MAMPPPTEQTSLLGVENEEYHPLGLSTNGKQSNIVQKLYQKRQEWLPLFLCGLLFFVVDFASYMRVAPKTRMFEMAFCRDYYQKVNPGVIDGNGEVPESLCKIEEIQQELALLKGWLNMLEFLPGDFHAVSEI